VSLIPAIPPPRMREHYPAGVAWDGRPFTFDGPARPPATTGVRWWRPARRRPRR